LPFRVLDENVETTPGHVSISTIHFAKGLEFCAVAVIGCDDEVSSLQRIEAVGDEADLEEVYKSRPSFTLCCVYTCSRPFARYGVDPASEYLGRPPLSQWAGPRLAAVF
jgi:hypothetical protein